MRKFAILATCAALAAVTPAQSQTIDFETTATGSYASGTLTLGGVTFSTALGTAFDINNYGIQGDGQSLLVPTDTDGNYLIGDLSVIGNAINLSFGNDDVFYTNAGDLATLQLFLGGLLVDQTTIVLNRNDVMDQQIGLSGTNFDRFTFAYTNAGGSPFTGGAGAVGLQELVDNITLRANAAVPEPGTWATMLLGFGMVGFAFRRQRRPVLTGIV